MGKCFPLAHRGRLGVECRFALELMISPELPAPFVVALITTYHRSSLLGRLLASMAAIRTPLAVVVVDNGDDPATAAVVEAYGHQGGTQGIREISRLVPGVNLGCGGGLEYGERAVLERYPQATHLWILDDDAEVTPGVLEQMLAAMEQQRAVAAQPCIVDEQGEIYWFPGVIDPKAFRLLKKGCTPADYLEKFGGEPKPFSWACGVSLLVARKAFEKQGFHRTDFWIRGEDLEFSLRLTYRDKGIFVPGAVVRHLPPAGAQEGERKKVIYLLRNHAYMALRLPHGRRILRSLAGNVWRFVKSHGLASVGEAVGAILRGAAAKLGPVAPPPAGKCNLTISLADQEFETTKSIGIFNVATSLAETFAADRRIHRLTVFSNSTIRSAGLGTNARVLLFDSVIKSKIARFIWTQWRIYSAEPTTPDSWLFLPKGFASVFKKPPCRLAAYVHDTMLFYYAAKYPGQMPFFESLYFRHALMATLKYADVIFTNSDFTRGEVLKLAQSLHIAAPPIVVAGIGFSAPLELPAAKKNQLLFLVSKWPHKLTALAIEYADRWQRETQYNGEVLWIGSIPETVRRPSHQNWRFYPRLPEAAYRKIFRESRVLVFFSDYEGFGMPPVEAAISHVCPVYSNVAAVSKVMGRVGFSFENSEYDSFARAVENGLNCPESMIKEWSETLLKAHSWAKVSETIIDTLLQVEKNLCHNLLVFAHIPPPHHGQSYMVKLMLDGFGRKRLAFSNPLAQPVACFHVDCRFSDGMEDIGIVRAGKLFLLLRYAAEAIWIRMRHGARTFYYVPAPGKRSALYRDWIVMALCRPFFSRIVLHWHASGLGEWLDKHGTPLERRITKMLLGAPDLSIAQAQASSEDAHWLRSKKIAIVPNGIPDPCPEFDRELLSIRKARAKGRQERIKAAESSAEPLIIRALYIAHCIREKGLFDSIEGVAKFNQQHREMRIHLTVAGSFMNAAEEQEFKERISQSDLAGAVFYAGFISGQEKKKLLAETDILCFPTYYSAESFGLVIVEAMAYGIPSVATTWRAIPEILPPDYPGFVKPQSPDEIADAFLRLAGVDIAAELRARFLENFSEASHLRQMEEAIKRLDRV